ncbi:MAG: two-component system, LytTR family, response regulator [Bacteroidales bacterium]|jgi:two-component system LytT family response regulator|nr:two-component system, LytTR family, response regulator [Bacteroidales bacterium]MDN5329118.1 two-component system, LytTR family, response regulator [Bacteroidales bacterium]
MKYKVFIVDDETASIDMLKYFCSHYFGEELEVSGFARTIDEAFRKIKELQPHLVFLDIRMPRGFGNELLDRFPKRQFEVIIVTAGLSKASFKNQQVLATLGKPLDEQEFVEGVRLFLNKMSEMHQS